MDIIDRSYPRWTTYAAIAIALSAATTRPLIEFWVYQTQPDDLSPFMVLGEVLDALTYVAIGMVLSSTGHLSTLRAAVFVIAWVGLNQALLALAMVPAAYILFNTGFAIWVAPIAILFGLAALLGAFARPRSWLRLALFVAARIAVLLFPVFVPSLDALYLPILLARWLSIFLQYGQPALAEFVLVLLCLELFAPCRVRASA